MTKKGRIWYCADCDVKWNNLGYALDACPKCSGMVEEIDVETRPLVTEDDVIRYINNAMSQADGYIVSDIVCWQCGKANDHYMVWPGIRAANDYTDVRPLLALPRCPIEVWRKADPKGIGLPLDGFLKRVKVKDNE